MAFADMNTDIGALQANRCKVQVWIWRRIPTRGICKIGRACLASLTPATIVLEEPW